MSCFPVVRVLRVPSKVQLQTFRWDVNCAVAFSLQWLCAGRGALTYVISLQRSTSFRLQTRAKHLLEGTLARAEAKAEAPRWGR